MRGRNEKGAARKTARRGTARGAAARGRLPAARAPSGKKTARRRTRSAVGKAPSSAALDRLRPQLASGLSALLGRAQRRLAGLPRVPQLKLLEVEAGGYTYTLSRLRPLADDNLTDRQKQIAWLVSEGLSNKGIAAKLRISPATVAAHLRTIFTKLRVKTRTALAKHARAYYG